MKIITSIIITFLLFSCGNTEEKSAKQIKMDEIQSEIDTLEKELSNIDTQIEIIGQLKYEVNNIKLLTLHWVENQTRSDSKEKMELIECEKKCIEIIAKIKDSKDFEMLNSQIKDIAQQLDEVLILVNEIKTTLPDFASYEDLSNQFLTQVMIEPGGDFDLTIENLLLEINSLKIFCQKEKAQVQIEIESKRLSLKNLSAY